MHFKVEVGSLNEVSFNKQLALRWRFEGYRALEGLRAGCQAH